MTTATIGDMRQATAIARHWIDGSWRDSAEHKDSINPATGEVIRLLRGRRKRRGTRGDGRGAQGFLRDQLEK